MMDKTAFSIRVYSFYLFAMGAALVCIPNFILPILGFAPSTEIWIRMLGLFTFTTGIYYFYAAAHSQMAFYKATIAGRFFFFAMSFIFVFVFNQPFMLAGVGAVDLLGGLWTYSTLNQKSIN